MGVAAYNRGSRVISQQIAREYGMPDPYPEYKPTPRPKGWGSKTRKKALDYASGLVRYFKKKGTKLSAEDLASYIQDRMKVGKKTALEVAKEALSESHQQRRSNQLLEAIEE